MLCFSFPSAGGKERAAVLPASVFWSFPSFVHELTLPLCVSLRLSLGEKKHFFTWYVRCRLGDSTLSPPCSLPHTWPVFVLL